MRRSVCLVSPGHVASNPRVVKEADALHGAGYRVTVIAGNETAFVRRFDEEIIAQAPWTVVRAGPASLSARLASRAAKAMARAWRPRATGFPPWLAVTAYSAQTSGLTAAACAVPAELYIAHYVAALPAAAAAAQLHGAALGYDAEDFHAGERASDAGASREIALVRTIEGKFLPRCLHRTAASPMIAEAYAELYGVELLPVLNVFPLTEAGEGPAPLRDADAGQGLSAYWFSQTVGPDRGLQAFIQAMARTRARVTLHVRGGDHWGHGKNLVALAQSLQIGDRVELLPMESPFRMIEFARQYDVGLSLEADVSESRRRCLTNKIFTYLLAGRPVLMSDTPAQTALAKDLGQAAGLVSLSDPATIADQLDRWALSPEALRAAQGAAWQLARTRYNWQIEQRAFLAAVARALKQQGKTSCPP
jgi:glycosyltransferase involved in cell wall biosynthesis